MIDMLLSSGGLPVALQAKLRRAVRDGMMAVQEGFHPGKWSQNPFSKGRVQRYLRSIPGVVVLAWHRTTIDTATVELAVSLWDEGGEGELSVMGNAVDTAKELLRVNRGGLAFVSG
jgi:hypothetical protein